MSDEREPKRGATVVLREVTEDTLSPILKLKVAATQEGFVANNTVSIAQAHFSKTAWFRAVYADEAPVGFVLLHLDAEKDGAPDYWVWRFMIGADHQGKGFGRDAMRHIVEHVRSLPGAVVLHLSHVPGEGAPGPFYAGLGFEYTGEEDEGELVMRLRL